MQILLPIKSGSLPSGFCPTTYQDMLDAFSAAQSALLTQSTNLIIQPNKPSASQTMETQMTYGCSLICDFGDSTPRNQRYANRKAKVPDMPVKNGP